MHALQTFSLLCEMEKEAVDQLLQGMKQLQEEMKIVRQGQEETALRLGRSAIRKESYTLKRRGNELQPRSINKQLTDKMSATMECIEKVDAKPPLSEGWLDWALKETKEGVFSSGVWPFAERSRGP